MSEFEKYIAGENSVWGKRRNNQGGRQLKPTEIAEMLNELERVKQERDVAIADAQVLAEYASVSAIVEDVDFPAQKMERIAILIEKYNE